MTDRDLRRTFDEDPVLYQSARPGYPASLLADLADLADLAGARVLEIGPGTGQATLDLVRLGAQVTAVELGPGLAAVLRQRLSGSATVVVCAFEDWPPPAEPFDAVAVFTAWHWLDPTVRTSRVAGALRASGSLATVTTSHVLGGTEPFFVDVQDCYERWDPATPPGLRQQSADDVPAAIDEVDSDPRFLPAVRRRYEQEISYTTGQYLDLLSTYSGHRALPPHRLRGLTSDIAALINEKYQGRIAKRYLYELRVAMKRTPDGRGQSRPCGAGA